MESAKVASCRYESVDEMRSLSGQAGVTDMVVE